MTPDRIAALRRFSPRRALTPPPDLTIPRPGSTTVRDLLNRYLAGILRDILQLPAKRLGGASGADLERVQGILADLAVRQPGAIVSLIRRPTFSVLVRCLTVELFAPEISERAHRLAAELVESALLELSFMGVLDHEVHLDRPVSRLSSLAHDFSFELSPPAVAARFRSKEAELVFKGGESALLAPDRPLPPRLSASRPFPRIAPSLALALVDNNPLAMMEAHPDKEGNAIALGDKPLDAWLTPLRESLEIIDTYLPEIGAEMRLVLHQIVPVGFDSERHLSASYAEAIGTVYMSLHPNLFTMTEALIHEYQHNKLNALLYLDPVLENLESELYASPVRPDPRPLRGVLLAVHAFQPIARLYEVMIERSDPRMTEDAKRRFSQIVKVNRDGCSVLLPNARPTPIGRSLFAEIARIDEHFGR